VALTHVKDIQHVKQRQTRAKAKMHVKDKDSPKPLPKNAQRKAAKNLNKPA